MELPKGNLDYFHFEVMSQCKDVLFRQLREAIHIQQGMNEGLVQSRGGVCSSVISLDGKFEYFRAKPRLNRGATNNQS